MNKRINVRAARSGNHPWEPFEAAFQEWIKQVTVRPFWDKEKRDAAVEEFYAAVVKSAAGIVNSPSFRWLRLSGLDLAHEWLADLESRRFRGYDHKRLFYPYGHKLLVRKCLNIRRHEEYRRVRGQKRERRCPRNGPVEQVAVNELIGQLQKAIPVLSSEERELAHRKYVLKESAQAIGAALGMTAAKVNARLHQIRLKLRLKLRGEDQQGAA